MHWHVHLVEGSYQLYVQVRVGLVQLPVRLSPRENNKVH